MAQTASLKTIEAALKAAALELEALKKKAQKFPLSFGHEQCGVSLGDRIEMQKRAIKKLRKVYKDKKKEALNREKNK